MPKIFRGNLWIICKTHPLLTEWLAYSIAVLDRAGWEVFCKIRCWCLRHCEDKVVERRQLKASPPGEGEQRSVGRAEQKCKVCVQPKPCPGSPSSPKAALVMMSFW